MRKELIQFFTTLTVYSWRMQHNMKMRPILGGIFGRDRYRMTTMGWRDNGLDTIRYVVLDWAMPAAIGFSETKAGALAEARSLIAMPEAVEAISTGARSRIEEEVEQYRHQRESYIQKETAAQRKKTVPKRRREIFDKSDGKCHYCATTLTLDGRWHIEHMQPRALLGPNDKSNLVAACVPCNMKKRDMTAEEFVAKLRHESKTQA